MPEKIFGKTLYEVGELSGEYETINKTPDWGIIIQARMSSVRLPGKVLLNVNGKPLLEYLLDRLKQSKKINMIVVATSTDESDEPIVNYCRRKKIHYFRGSLNNVAKRFKDTIEKYELAYFIRINADSPLIDSKIIDAGVEIFTSANYEIVTNCLYRTFPKGQSVEIFRSEAFIKGFEKIQKAEEFEHLSSYFYRNSEEFKIFNIQAINDNYSGINLCVDTKEDLDLFTKILHKMNKTVMDYNWEEIVRIYRSIKNNS